MIQNERLRICLILEGTYPYVRGGVSAWTHQLIQQLPDIDFFLLTLSPKANQSPAYPLPPNVVGSRDVVLQAATDELASRKRFDANGRLEQIGALLGDDAHPEVKALLRDLHAAAELNPMRGRSSGRRPARYADMRRFWADILQRYRVENPYYPLGEYFWTWFNTRAMLLSLLQIDIPPAHVYHALCTGYAGFVGAICRAVTGRPLVLTEHGIYHRERAIEIESSTALRGHQRDQWTSTFYALSRLTYGTADQIITLFEANRALELRFGAPPERSRVIPNGIDLPFFRAVQRSPRPGFHVGLVGRIVPIKDVKTFIVAARGVLEEIPDAHFHLIGPLDEAPEYVRECEDLVAAFGMEERVVFTGQQDVRDYYAFLNVVVLSSLSEAQPLVLLEALAAGVPAVATRVGDVSGLLTEDDRFIALPKDAEGLARRIVNIRANHDSVMEWVQSRQEALDTVYNRAVVFASYGELYQSWGAAGGVLWPV